MGIHYYNITLFTNKKRVNSAEKCCLFLSIKQITKLLHFALLFTHFVFFFLLYITYTD